MVIFSASKIALLLGREKSRLLALFLVRDSLWQLFNYPFGFFFRGFFSEIGTMPCVVDEKHPTAREHSLFDFDYWQDHFQRVNVW